MAKYAYPAIFTPEEKGYSIVFPDLEGCYTCGDSLEDGLEMARDALALVLYGYEKDGRKIPVPSKVKTLSVGENEFATYVACDTMKYRKMYNNKTKCSELFPCFYLATTVKIRYNVKRR